MRCQAEVSAGTWLSVWTTVTSILHGKSWIRELIPARENGKPVHDDLLHTDNASSNGMCYMLIVKLHDAEKRNRKKNVLTLHGRKIECKEH